MCPSLFAETERLSKFRSRKLDITDLSLRVGYRYEPPFLSCLAKDSVHQLGWSALELLYPRAIEIAKEVTGLDNDTQAVKSFRRFIDSPSMYFNQEPFPKNESDERAHRKCNSERGKMRPTYF